MILSIDMPEVVARPQTVSPAYLTSILSPESSRPTLGVDRGFNEHSLHPRWDLRVGAPLCGRKSAGAGGKPGTSLAIFL